jgi:hypothetical protein
MKRQIKSGKYDMSSQRWGEISGISGIAAIPTVCHGLKKRLKKGRKEERERTARGKAGRQEHQREERKGHKGTGRRKEGRKEGRNCLVWCSLPSFMDPCYPSPCHDGSPFVSYRGVVMLAVAATGNGSSLCFGLLWEEKGVEMVRLIFTMRMDGGGGGGGGGGK